MNFEPTPKLAKIESDRAFLLRIQDEIKRIDRAITRAVEDKKALQRTISIAFASTIPQKKTLRVPYSPSREMLKIMKEQNHGYSRADFTQIMKQKFGVVKPRSLSGTLSGLKNPQKTHPPKVESNQGLWYSTEVPRIAKNLEGNETKKEDDSFLYEDYESDETNEEDDDEHDDEHYRRKMDEDENEGAPF